MKIGRFLPLSILAFWILSLTGCSAIDVQWSYPPAAPTGALGEATTAPAETPVAPAPTREADPGEVFFFMEKANYEGFRLSLYRMDGACALGLAKCADPVRIDSLPENAFVSVPQMAWAPDGSTAAVAGMGPDLRYHLFLFQPKMNTWQEIAQYNSFASFTPRWSPDGTRIAIVTFEADQPALTVYAADGERSWNLTEGRFSGPRAISDYFWWGNSIAALMSEISDPGLWLLPVESAEEPRRLLPLDPAYSYLLAGDPDARSIAILTADQGQAIPPAPPDRLGLSLADSSGNAGSERMAFSNTMPIDLLWSAHGTWLFLLLWDEQQNCTLQASLPDGSSLRPLYRTDGVLLELIPAPMQEDSLLMILQEPPYNRLYRIDVLTGAVELLQPLNLSEEGNVAAVSWRFRP